MLIEQASKATKSSLLPLLNLVPSRALLSFAGVRYLFPLYLDPGPAAVPSRAPTGLNNSAYPLVTERCGRPIHEFS